MAVRAVPLGREATQTLRALIAEAKASDPFAAVTVAVSSVPCGVQLRRALVADGRPEGPGLFNVRFVTLPSLVRQVTQGVEPCPRPVQWALARRALAEDAGPLASCRDHPDLPLALLRAFEELDASARPSGPLEPLWRRYRQAMGDLGFTDPSTLGERLPDRLPEDLGVVIVHLPAPPTRSEETLLRGLERAGAVLVLAVTGDERADAWFQRWCPKAAAPERPTLADTLLACTDAEEEVREAVRRVWQWAEQGLPLERCAILFRRRHPYARIAFDVLREARLPAYGRSPFQLADSLVGLTVAVALDAVQGGFDSDRMFDWLGAVRLRTCEDKPVDVDAWRRLVRELGVRTNLEALRRWLGRRGGPSASSFEAFLNEWLAGCHSLFGPGESESWSVRVRRLLEWVDSLLPDEGLPEPERRLKERWRAKATELQSAEAVQERVDGPEFAWYVRQTLSGDGRALGRLGTGVFVGTFEEARGMDLDAAALLGLAEGLCPTIVRGDPILGMVPSGLPPVAEQVDREREMYLVALATGTKARIVTFPRVDRVDGSSFLPSRWIGDQLRSQGRGTEAFERAESFEGRLLQGGFASECEIRAVGLPSGRASRWQQRWEERRQEEPGSHTGFVAPMPERLLSPITVSLAVDFFECPHRFFLKDVLRVAETEAARDQTSVDPRKLGTALHSALSRFLLGVRVESWPEEWTEEHRAELQRLVGEALDGLEREGWVRRPALWSHERGVILRLAPLLLDMEAAVRGARKLMDARTELWNGGSSEPVRVPTGAREILLEGRMDLVEFFEEEVAVMDVKLGGPPRDHSQVWLYLTMLERIHPGKRIQGAYLPLRGNGQPSEVRWASETKSAVAEKLEQLAEHIVAGRFPLTPNKEDREGNRHCTFCAYRRLCPGDRGLLQELYRDWAEQRASAAGVQEDADV